MSILFIELGVLLILNDAQRHQMFIEIHCE